MKHGKNAHCSFCGKAFAKDQPWPRTCAGCNSVSYVNPIPVAVLLLPVDNGLLCVRRAIEPGKGKLALPGGYVDFAETWQQAAARELQEEAGVSIDPAAIRDFYARSSTAGDGTLLIFGVGPRLASDDMPTFSPTEETSVRIVIRDVQPLAFPLHTDTVRDYFARRVK